MQKVISVITEQKSEENIKNYKSMQKIMNIVWEDAKKLKITKKAIAKLLGVSPALVTQYFKTATRIDFIQFIELLAFVYGEVKIEMVHAFLSAEGNEIFNIQVVDWAYNMGKLDLMENVIQKEMNKKDIEIHPIFDLYHFLLKRGQGGLRKSGQLLHLLKLNLWFDQKRSKTLTKLPEVKALMLICSVMAMKDEERYKECEEFIEQAFTYINKMIKTSRSNQYLKKSYSLQLKEVQAELLLRRARNPEAREVCLSMVGSVTEHCFMLRKITGYSLLSQSYILDDYIQGVRYAEKSIELFQEQKFNDYKIIEGNLKTTYDLLKIYNYDFENLYLIDQEETAHYFARQLDPFSKKKSIELLDKLIEEGADMDAYQKFYRGIALDDISLLQEANLEFKAKNLEQYALMVQNEIKRKKI